MGTTDAADAGFAPTDRVLPLRTSVAVDGWVHVSGQVGHVDFRLVEGGFEAELRQALTNLRAEIGRHGGTLRDVVKTTVLLASIDDFAAMNAIYLEYFDHAALPARTAYAVAGLPFGACVELEAVAHVAAGG